MSRGEHHVRFCGADGCGGRTIQRHRPNFDPRSRNRLVKKGPSIWQEDWPVVERFVAGNCRDPLLAAALTKTGAVAVDDRVVAAPGSADKQRRLAEYGHHAGRDPDLPDLVPEVKA